MAHTVIDYKTWRTLQPLTGNLSNDRALIVPWHWSLSMQTLHEAAPTCEEQNGIRVPAMAVTPSLHKMHIDVQHGACKCASLGDARERVMSCQLDAVNGPVTWP